MKAVRLASFSSALVSWNRKLLLAEPPPLAMKKNLYSSPWDGLDLDLGRQVVARCSSRRTSTAARAVSTAGSRSGTCRRCPGRSPACRRPPVKHVLALLGLDDGGAGVLAAGQDAGGRDVGVLEQLEGHEVVVRPTPRRRRGWPAAGPGGRGATGGRCRACASAVSAVMAASSTSRNSRPPRSIDSNTVVGDDPAVVGGVGLDDRGQVGVLELGHVTSPSGQPSAGVPG